MNKYYINEVISIKELVSIINIDEIEFIKKTFFKGIIIKKNEILSFETAKFLCKSIFNINILKKDLNEKKINNSFKNFFLISIIGNVNSGKTTLMDFIFKKNNSFKEYGKITQFISIFEIFFLKKKIFFFDLPGHNVFNAIINIYINISDMLFLIISIENELDDVYHNILNIIKEKNINVFICINKIDKNPSKKIFISNYKNFKISSKNGFGVKKLLLESINFLNKIENKNFFILNDGFIINSYYENNDFVVNLFLYKNILRKNSYIYFKNEKVFLNNFFINNIEIEMCKSPCFLKVKNVYFPIDIFFKIESNFNYKTKEIYKENYFKFDNFFIKSDNHTISFSIMDFYNNLKNNNKINIIKNSLGNFTEKDLNYCINFKCKLLIINLKLNNDIKKKLIFNNIFYKEFKLINDVLDFLKKEYNFDKKEIITGELLVKDIFPCGRNKKIAGCYVYSGFLNIENEIRVYKELKLIFQGKINTLKIKNKLVSKVNLNDECGINIKNFNDIEIGLKIFSISYDNK